MTPATLPVDFFSPLALIDHVDRRRPAAEVAALFGLETRDLIARIRNLRRDDPDFPVRRRRLRRIVYVEPIPAAPAAEPSKVCAGPCARRLHVSAFANYGAGISTTCRECLT